MPYYRVAGEVPRKRHVRFRSPAGTPVRRGADGRGGLRLRLLAAVPRAPADGDREERGRDRRSGRGAAGAESSAAAPAFPHARPASRRRPGARQAADDGQRRRADLVSRPQPPTRTCTATQSGDEAVYLRSGSATFESVYGTIEAGAGDYVIVPRGTIHRWRPERRRRARAGRRGARSYPAAAPVPVAVRPVP